MNRKHELDFANLDEGLVFDVENNLDKLHGHNLDNGAMVPCRRIFPRKRNKVTPRSQEPNM